MAEKIVSPGVFTNEIDQSFLPAAIADIGAALIGPTVKGPAGIPTIVTSYSEYQSKFGDAFKSGSDYYQYLTSHTAKEYFKGGGTTMTVVRILAGDYSHASTTISSSIDPAVVGGGAKATGSFTYVAGTWGDGGAEASMSIGGVYFTITGSDTYTNSSTNIYVVSSSGDTTTAFAERFRDAVNNSSSLHSLSISASSNTNTVELTSSLAGRMHGNDGLSLAGGSAISGTLNIIKSSNAFNPVSQLQGGEEYNNAAYTEVLRLHTHGDGEILNSVGPIGTNNVLESGSKDNLRFEISTRNNNKGTFTLVIRRGDDIQKRKQILETWNNLTLDENTSNYIGKAIGDSTWTLQQSGETDPYLQLSGSYPNKSNYVRVEVLQQTVDYLDENGDVRISANSASLPSVGSGSEGGAFSDGSDGTVQNPKNFYDNITDINSQGLNLSIGASGKTAYEDAINILGNQDEYDINLILLPGVIDSETGGTSILTKAIDMCETRGDCFVIVDPVLYASSPTQATTEAETRDTNYAATYWPWVQIPDNVVGISRWVPPSVVIPGVYAFNDKVAHPWFAPAGLNRGGLTTAIQTERKLTHTNRDTLYESNVNPIAMFPGQGVTVWGQKTLQKKSSALDRVNVRRLLIKLKKFIASSSRYLVFEQNNSATRNRFLNMVNPYLETVQSQSGLSAFKVVMDDSNNTPDVVDRNQLVGQIFLQPTRTAEFIVLDFVVMPTGAAFPE